MCIYHQLRKIFDKQEQIVFFPTPEIPTPDQTKFFRLEDRYQACELSHFSRVWLFVTPWTPRSPPGSSVHGDSPGKNTGEGCHALLQGIFLTQESNLHLWEVGSLPLAHLEDQQRGTQIGCCSSKGDPAIRTYPGLYSGKNGLVHWRGFQDLTLKEACASLLREQQDPCGDIVEKYVQSRKGLVHLH